MPEPYFYVRFRWWKEIDLKEREGEFKEKFKIKQLKMPRSDDEFSLYKDLREEMVVEADTLKAMLAPLRAVLFQKNAAPLTRKDMELRKMILELYPRDRPTPFPWEFSVETKFEVEES